MSRPAPSSWEIPLAPSEPRAYIGRVPLKLVVGPANSAKAGEVLGAYTAATARGALLVVPTAVDAEHYARELAEQGSVLGSVLTFRGLIEEVAVRAGYRGARLSELQRERVLRRVIRRLELRALEESARAPGFVLAAGRFVAELERSLVPPQRFAQALRAWGAGDERREAYAEDLAALYLGYARELDRLRRVDAELHAWRALDALRREPGAWGATPTFFYGFDDFSAVERDAIETLCRVVGTEVTVSLTFEAGRGALAARAEAVAELRALAGEVLELPARDEHYVPPARAALHHLERHLFEPGAERVDPGDAVRLLEAGGERAEAELLAAEVLELLAAGVPQSEIVVVCRSLAAAAPLLEQVFRDYGIAVAVDVGGRFAHTALGRSVIALARCALLADAGASDLLAYLRTPGLVERIEIVDRLEAMARREALTSATQLRERFEWELDEIDAVRGAEAPLTELVRHARRLFAAPYRGSGAVLETRDELQARALAALVRAAQELEELGERMRGRELIELLERLELPRRVRASGDRVLLADPLAIRARRFEAVLVCGLGEGLFPLPGAGDPFLSDERRRELAIASGLALGGVEDALARERYLLYACVSRATKRVVLSWCSSDEEGNVALPSPFISDVRELFVPEWFERRCQRLLADVVWPPAQAPTERERERARAATRGANGEAGPMRYELTEPALAHVRHVRVVSGNALETYSDCPMRWLVESELAPKRLEPEPEPLARGSYVHNVLQDVLDRLGGPITTDSLPDATRLLDEVMAELPEEILPGRPPGVREAARRSMAADLRRYFATEARGACGFEPRWLELRFGFEEEQASLPPLVLRRDDQQVVVRGAVDRVDSDGERAIVRDYKTGRVRPEYQGARWEEDRRLQVALYMIAVRELLGLEPVAGLYQPIGGKDLRARGVYLRDAPVGERLFDRDARDAEELREVLDGASGRAVELAMRLRSGELEPCPSTCSRNGCVYPGICRSW